VPDIQHIRSFPGEFCRSYYCLPTDYHYFFLYPVQQKEVKRCESIRTGGEAIT
jgi:hypothetical protein